MIHSFIFSDGRLVGQNLEMEVLRLVHADKGLLLWVDLEEPTEEETRLILEGIFQFHPLAIEDCVSDSPLPKLEDYDDYLFLVTHAVDFSRTEKFNTTALDLFLGKDTLVTFHRKPLKSVGALREKLQKASNLLAVRSADRLAHLVLDSIVDNYQPAMNEFRGELEEIEQAVLAPVDTNLNAKLLEVRGEISHLRQIIRPQLAVVSRLTRGDSKMIRSAMLPYFRDLRDNLVRIEETAVGYSDQLLISFDLYLSKSSFQANDGIKALTALTAISLPATVVGSWYGMNFVHMPEIYWKYGYHGFLLLTLLLTFLTWRWCKKRRWI